MSRIGVGISSEGIETNLVEENQRIHLPHFNCAGQGKLKRCRPYQNKEPIK